MYQSDHQGKEIARIRGDFSWALRGTSGISMGAFFRHVIVRSTVSSSTFRKRTSAELRKRSRGVGSLARAERCRYAWWSLEWDVAGEMSGRRRWEANLAGLDISWWKCIMEQTGNGEE